MTKKLETTTLIDKIKLSNIPVDSIGNMEDLKNRGILSCDSGKQKYLTRTGQEISYLFVSDRKIDKYEVRKRKDSYHTKMELSIRDEKSGNFYCHTVDEVMEHVKQIRDHLIDQYGIVVCTSEPKINYIELNRTFPIDGNFEDYKRALILMMSRLPKNKGVQMDFKEISSDGYKLNEYAAKNKSSQFKIYNKSMQMKLNLEADHMRVEITLLKSSVVKRELGSNLLNDLTDQKIDQYFRKYMEDFFVKPLEQWREISKSEIKKLIVATRKKDVHWISSVLGSLLNKEVQTGIPSMLDIEQLYEALDELKFKRTNRLKAQFQNRVEKVYTVFNQNDGDKLKEVIDKLTQECQITRTNATDLAA